jgi:hypothetical protein
VGLYIDLCRTGIVQPVQRQSWTASVRQGHGIILNSTASRPTLGPTQSLFQLVIVSFLIEIKRPKREAAHSLSSSAELYITPHTSLPGGVPSLSTGTILPYRVMAVTWDVLEAPLIGARLCETTGAVNEGRKNNACRKKIKIYSKVKMKRIT